MTLGMIHGMTHTGADRHLTIHTIHTIHTILTDRHLDLTMDLVMVHILVLDIILVLFTQAVTPAVHRADIQVQPVAAAHHRAITLATAQAKAEDITAEETTYAAMPQVAAHAAAAHQPDH